MTLDQIHKICEPIHVSGPEPKAIGALTLDSRKVEEGSVFIAVRGTRLDGHTFIDAAAKQGASVIICEDVPESDFVDDVCMIQVADSRSLVGPLAQAFAGNPAEKLKIIGITGTNGKTTVATLTYQVLSELGVSVSLLGTVEKRIGNKISESRLTTADPVELAEDMQKMVGAGSTHLIMEVSSHALDQQRTHGLDFDIAAFTNLSHDHLDYHAGIDEYAESKKTLFDGLSKNASAVVNMDDSYAKVMLADCQAEPIGFSFKDYSETRCRIVSHNSEGLVIDVDGVEVRSPLVGVFNAYNIAEVFLICRAMGYEAKKIARALENVKGAAGRMERVRVHNGIKQPRVFVDYAHTPDALENVLSTLADMKTDQETLKVVFGCGGDRDRTKRPRMAAISEKYADEVIITSDNPRNEDPDVIIDDAMAGFKEPERILRIADREKAIRHAVNEADMNTIILIAGKGHETYQEVNGIKQDFDDRKVAREALRELAVNTVDKGGA